MKARSTIANTSWIKDTKNFKFENYCQRIQSANRDLDRLQANVDGRSQVISFLQGIKADHNTNTHLMAVKTQILSHTIWSDKLDDAIIHFKDMMNKLGGMTNNQSRNISAVYMNLSLIHISEPTRPY